MDAALLMFLANVSSDCRSGCDHRHRRWMRPNPGQTGVDSLLELAYSTETNRSVNVDGVDKLITDEKDV